MITQNTSFAKYHDEGRVLQKTAVGVGILTFIFIHRQLAI